jgi:glucose/arabinose dehydrogenase
MADQAKPTTPTTKKTARERAAGLQNAFAALSAVPDAGAEEAAPAARAPRQPRARKEPPAAKSAAAMPAEQAKPPVWDARISLTLSREMKRALDLARAEDGLELTARIRAMITLWQDDDRLRARVDKLAKTLR